MAKTTTLHALCSSQVAEALKMIKLSAVASTHGAHTSKVLPPPTFFLCSTHQGYGLGRGTPS